jgi:RimJ/RimL family protein N-acetyltransferase
MDGTISAPPTEFIGPRILVRRMDERDTPAVFATARAARAHLAPWLHWPRQLHSLDATQAALRDDHMRWLRRDRFALGIFNRAEGTFLGGITLGVEEARIPSFDLAYWVRPDAEGRGYVSEAARLVTACAFDRLGARRVAIYCDPRNVRSARVAERLGFAFEGRLRQDALTPDGDVRDTLAFAMIPEDYERTKTTWDH